MKHVTLIFAFCLTALCACNNIGEDERYIIVESTTPPGGEVKQMRRVLIEDFTGQRCINCPNAADEIERLKESYGADSIIAVGIHGGDLAFKSTEKLLGLRTDLGDEYNSYWKVEAWPQGLINRSGSLANIDQWFTLVSQARNLQAPLSIEVAGSYDETSRQLAINVKANAFENVSGKLQLWLTESGIVAMQSMPDGTNNREYVHNHVLRAAVNGDWGEDFSTIQGQEVSIQQRFTIDPSWQPSKMSVVAFVYNDQGVLQVVEKEIEMGQ